MEDILFYNEEHESCFYKFVEMFGEKPDEYRLAAAYLLALDSECRRHYKDIFDFDEGVIKPEGLNREWQTGTSTKTTRLLFNLWNGYQSEGEERYYTPEHIFACSYAPYYWQAIKLRFPFYVEE